MGKLIQNGLIQRKRDKMNCEVNNNRLTLETPPLTHTHIYKIYIIHKYSFHYQLVLFFLFSQQKPKFLTLLFFFIPTYIISKTACFSFLSTSSTLILLLLLFLFFFAFMNFPTTNHRIIITNHTIPYTIIIIICGPFMLLFRR